MFSELGLTNIDVKMKETGFFLEPPYEGEQQQHRLKQLRQLYTDLRTNDYWKSRYREEFLSGGGSIEDYDRYSDLMDQFYEDALREMDSNRFAACGGYLFYIAKGRKPTS